MFEEKNIVDIRFWMIFDRKNAIEILENELNKINIANWIEPNSNVHILRIETDNEQIGNVISNVIEILLKTNGLTFEWDRKEINLWIEYKKEVNLQFSKNQLQKILRLDNEYISICLDSHRQDEENSSEIESISESIKGSYNQLYFSSQIIETELNVIRELWNKYNFKFNKNHNWDLKLDENRYLVLTLTNKWGDAFKYLTNFIQTNQPYFEKNNIKTAFGEYHYFYSGGEISNLEFERLIELNMDLIITKSAISPLK